MNDFKLDLDSFAAGLVAVMIFFCLLFGGIGYWIGVNTTLQSRTRINPTFQLTTDGTKVDTLFIYKLPKQK